MATGKSGEAVLIEGESSCFYHPAKKAAIACESCGRFLCALCDVDWNGQHICPACLESGRTKGKLKNLETKRFLYDGIAFGLATLPLLIFYLTPLTAPIAIYVAIRYWNAPSSVIPRTKARFIFAIIIATLQITGWALLAYFVFNRMSFPFHHGR
jgi:hypothetical protein